MKRIILRSLRLITMSLFIMTACGKTTPTASPVPSSNTSVPSTNTPTSTLQSTETIVPTPTLGIGSTMISEKDGATLVYVPEGEFTMGSDSSNLDEKPTHAVYLDAFWIDQTEVTNKQYAACVASGGCTSLSSNSSYTHFRYYGNVQFDDFPVIYVDWNQADVYCSWADRRLPTEAEWEKAARGADERIYPWGNDAPNNDLLNYNSTIGDTTEVGSYERGKSFYGAYDMAGNVREWVHDLYDETYYQSSPSSNPLGPDLGNTRVLRGGAWNSSVSYIHTTFRAWNYPTNAYINFGFRCVQSP